MSSVSNAIELMTFFSATRPEIGLSEMRRLAGRDKATTYRHLQALQSAGFIEQNPETKNYRLGPALLQLAQLREQTVPRKAAARAAIQTLANVTGETTHVSVMSGSTLYALDSCESEKHSTRAIIDITIFPLHATASGLCALAFGSADLVGLAQAELKQFTASTPMTEEALASAVAHARQSGFSRSMGTFEADIYSMSAPLFDQDGHFAGSVSVASVATRFDDALERTIMEGLVAASKEITRNWGGRIPPHLIDRWDATLGGQTGTEQTT
jgi:DNA-binding IclR family transcriptional regulator